MERELGRQHAAEMESLVASHAAAKGEWEARLDAEVHERMVAEREALEASFNQRRAHEVETVVGRLGAEMAAASKAAEQRLERETSALRAQRADAADAADARESALKEKYVRAVEVQGELEAKLRAATEELASANARAGATAAEAQAARDELAAEAARAEEEKRRAASAAECTAAQALGERQALADEIAQLHNELRVVHTKNAEAVADVRARQDAELQKVDERVRQAIARKDAAIGSLQEQLAHARTELHETRQQLHSTQQEILGIE